jgi:2-polyprenyl-3-methyl-5-hydroxy-6-metoxy-1,4-benzoquinol methylase
MSRVDVATFYDSISEGYSQQYQRENLETAGKYPANYFRLQIFVQRMAELGLTSIYEVGVGEGTPLATLAAMGFRVAGCDIADAMVKRSKETFERHGLDPALIQWGDIQDSTTFVSQLRGGAFDAVIAAGVLPHVANDALCLRNMAMTVRPGGRLFVEFRNKLFSLFTLNRYTKDFILDDLLKGVDGSIKDVVAAELDKRLATDLPPVRTVGGDGKAPGYDVILSKFHNPFELTETFERLGFKVQKIHWYHYHPAPPMLEGKLGAAFNKAARAMEHEDTWRGHFLCSAGVVEAVKPG